jgi:hypothetical protein
MYNINKMQVGANVDSVSVYRPPEYRLSPQYKVGVSESATQVFRMQTEALHMDEKRASFVVRSPGLGVILSPQVYISCGFQITCRAGNFSYDQIVGACLGDYDARASGVDGLAAAVSAPLLACRPKLCFSGGDVYSKAQTSYNLTINGASVSNHNQELYFRSLLDCWVAPKTFQARFSQAGGETDRYDAVCTSGEAALGGVEVRALELATGDRHTAYKAYGFTGDSGRSRRCKNLYACIEELEDGTATTDVFKVRLQIPVQGCGILSPFTQYDELASSCPLTKSMGALCNMNNFSLEILTDNLVKQIFRNLSGTRAARNVAGNDYNGAGNFADGNPAADYQIVMLTDDKYKPRLLTTWLRLSSWRSLPASITASTYRITVHRATSKPYVGAGVIHPDALDQAVELTDVLSSVGAGRRIGGRAAQRVGIATKVCTATWQALQSSQVPEFLFFCFQKTPKIFTLDSKKGIADLAGAAGFPVAASDIAPGLRNLMYSRNQDANASIVDFELTVMSSVGSFVFSSDYYPFIKKRRQLWYEHYKNCVDGYCDSDINIWVKNRSCLLLHCSSWIRGIATNSTAFPIQITASIKFQNLREQVDGHCATADNCVGTAVLPDFIAGEPVCCQIYPNGSMVIAASSAVSAAANLSHSTGLDLLSRQ